MEKEKKNLQKKNAYYEIKESEYKGKKYHDLHLFLDLENGEVFDCYVLLSIKDKKRLAKAWFKLSQNGNHAKAK